MTVNSPRTGVNLLYSPFFEVVYLSFKLDKLCKLWRVTGHSSEGVERGTCKRVVLTVTVGKNVKLYYVIYSLFLRFF